MQVKENQAEDRKDDKKLLFEPVQALKTKIRKCQTFFCF